MGCPSGPVVMSVVIGPPMLLVTEVLEGPPAWEAVTVDSDECGGVELLGESWLDMEDGVEEGGTLLGVLPGG